MTSTRKTTPKRIRTPAGHTQTYHVASGPEPREGVALLKKAEPQTLAPALANAETAHKAVLPRLAYNGRPITPLGDSRAPRKVPDYFHMPVDDDDLTYVTTDPETGGEVWRCDEYVIVLLNSNAHSLNDEPAHIESSGALFWYKHGMAHRYGGPCTTYPNGLELWKVFGKLHRDGGKPAKTVSEGQFEYFVMGVEYPTSEAAAEASAEQIQALRRDLITSGGMTPEAIASRQRNEISWLAQSPSVSVNDRLKLAKDPGATDATLDRLLQDEHPDVRETARFYVVCRERLYAADAEDAAAREL